MRTSAVVASFAALAASAPLNLPVGGMNGAGMPFKLPVGDMDAGGMPFNLPVSDTGAGGLPFKMPIGGDTGAGGLPFKMPIGGDTGAGGMPFKLPVGGMIPGMPFKRAVPDSVSSADLPVDMSDTLNDLTADIKRDISGLGAPFDVSDLLDDADVFTELPGIDAKRDLVNVELPTTSAATIPVSVDNLLDDLSASAKRDVQFDFGGIAEEIESMVSSALPGSLKRDAQFDFGGIAEEIESTFSGVLPDGL